jgi:hypothetical protein
MRNMTVQAYALSAVASLVVLIGGDKALFGTVMSNIFDYKPTFILSKDVYLYIGYVILFTFASVLAMYALLNFLLKSPVSKYGYMTKELQAVNVTCFRKAANLTANKKILTRELAKDEIDSLAHDAAKAIKGTLSGSIINVGLFLPNDAINPTHLYLFAIRDADNVQRYQPSTPGMRFDIANKEGFCGHAFVEQKSQIGPNFKWPCLDLRFAGIETVLGFRTDRRYVRRLDARKVAKSYFCTPIFDTAEDGSSFVVGVLSIDSNDRSDFPNRNDHYEYLETMVSTIKETTRLIAANMRAGLKVPDTINER